MGMNMSQPAVAPGAVAPTVPGKVNVEKPPVNATAVLVGNNKKNNKKNAAAANAGAANAPTAPAAQGNVAVTVGGGRRRGSRKNRNTRKSRKNRRGGRK